MPKKKVPPAPEPEEPTFDVVDEPEPECINEARVTKTKQTKHWEYNIKWGGYAEAENSWEPEANLTGCRRMMRGFWEQVGTALKGQAKILPVGHTVHPSELWKKRERESYMKSAARKNSQKATHETGDADEAHVASTSRLDDSDDDDIPLSIRLASRALVQSTQDHMGSNSNMNAASASKRKLLADTDQQEDPSKPPNKRQKYSAEPSITQAPTPVLTSSNGEDTETLRPPSPTNSLFDGDGLNSDGMSVATPSNSRPVQSQPTPRPSLSLDTTGPKEISLPEHQKRKLHPRIKSMVSPAAPASGLGGISTKARILSQSAQRPTGLSAADNPPSPAGLVPGTANSPINANSPNALKSAVSIPELDVNMWLKNNILSKEELARTNAAPLASSSADPSSMGSPAQQGLHFSKRWRWSGQLAVGDNESDDGLAEPVGGIVLTDNTTLDPKAGQMGIHVLIPSDVDTLCFRHQYSLASFQTVLNDFKISQFAQMMADESSDDNCFQDLVAYMTKYELFSQSPLTIADYKVATMFVFPASLEYLWDRVGVPPKVRQTHGLLVAVGFQSYVPPKRAIGGPMGVYRSDWKTDSRLDIVPEMQEHACTRAILTLKFPQALFKRLAHKECAIYTTPIDTGVPGPESLALYIILRSAKNCTVVPVLTGSARLIFIHVGAWDMIHRLPGLVDRRLRRPDVQFYTYGSDPAVERKRWGIQQVFPIGGVVTFTPRAITEDPEGVERLIARLDEHPMWTCYVLPAVVAMVVEVANADAGPNSELKNAVNALCGILIPLEKGQIDLTWQPPSRVASYRERDSDRDFKLKWLDWMVDQARLSELSGSELVLECQNRFMRGQDRSEKDVETRIVKDLLVMQSELREEYRRFVIITDTSGPSNTSKKVAASTSVSKADIKDGFEFTNVKDFTFGDDYFVDERN